MLVIIFLLTIFSMSFAGESGFMPQPQNIPGAGAYIYKQTEQGELRIHYFRPKAYRATKKVPAIVFFFGGGWMNGKITQFAPQAEYLAGRGMAAFVADYRVFNRHGTSPFEGLADAKSAIRWIRANADFLNVDAKRVAASGGSAGGHLALATAMFEKFDEASEDLRISSKPDALVLFNPGLDLTKPHHIERFGERVKNISPIQNLSKALPPMVILHGTADMRVPYEKAEKFCREVNALGGQCRLYGYTGAKHGFFDSGSRRDDTINKMARFLTKLGYLKPTN